MGAIGYVVHYFGNRYIAESEMALIFHRRMRALIEAGEGELVPLRHVEGIDLLWIAAEVPCRLEEITVPPGADLDKARARWGLRCHKSTTVAPTGRISDPVPRRSTGS
ncbi:MAG: hypothetical protein Q7T15_01560 [Microcella sp.]|uniref:hypothetical protein n=1 Tax=Microcella sp. TaxID=1913979 RepID=UPI00271D1F28|nr:hypothetical protein [Microcella sp.]MDO8336924.1 hypothetical protein [Microcella sp.]